MPCPQDLLLLFGSAPSQEEMCKREEMNVVLRHRLVLIQAAHTHTHNTTDNCEQCGCWLRKHCVLCVCVCVCVCVSVFVFVVFFLPGNYALNTSHIDLLFFFFFLSCSFFPCFLAFLLSPPHNQSLEKV